MGGQDELLISYDYPHGLLLHLHTLLEKRGASGPEAVADEAFLEDFFIKYKSCPHEVRELQSAYREKLIQGFISHSGSPEWEKRAFVLASMLKLIHRLKEWEAVELVESLMCLFGWRISFTLSRRWQVADEDRAVFHQKMDLSKWNLIDAKEQIQWQKRENIDNDTITDDIQEVPAGREDESAAAKERLPQAMEHTDYTGNILEQEEDRQLPHMVKNEETPLTGQRRQQTAKEHDRETRHKSAPTAKEKKIKYLNQMSLGMRREVKQAKRGNAKAQQKLGDFYTEKNSSHLDYQEAIYWYTLSAKQNNFTAQMQLGKLYDSGKIQLEDSKQQGLFWYRKLAKEGFPTAQCILGLKYLWGDGVKADQKEAVFWLKKAASQGCQEAGIYLKSHNLPDL